MNQIVPPYHKAAEAAWLRFWWSQHEPRASWWVRVLRALACWAPFGRQVIAARGSDEPYLLRTYLTPRIGRLPQLYLHYFFRSDNANELHNHPWGMALSLLLVAGYLEAKPDKTGRLVWKSFQPGDLNLIFRWGFHRVMLRAQRAWSLVLVCWRVDEPRETAWGFWDKETGRYETHSEYKKRIDR